MYYCSVGVPLAKRGETVGWNDILLGGCDIVYICESVEETELVYENPYWDASPQLPFPFITEDGRSWCGKEEEVSRNKAETDYFIAYPIIGKYGKTWRTAVDSFAGVPDMCVVRFATRIKAKDELFDFPDCHFRAALYNAELIRVDEHCNFSTARRVFEKKCENAHMGEINWNGLRVDPVNEQTGALNLCGGPHHCCLSCNVGEQYLSEFLKKDRNEQSAAVHKRLLDVALALSPLRLPPYVMLEIVERLFCGFGQVLNHGRTISLLIACFKFSRDRKQEQKPSKQAKLENAIE